MAVPELPADFSSWSLDRKNAFSKALRYNWGFWARPEQLIPDLDDPWDIWMILSGRGWGKTRTGAEAIKKLMQDNPGARVGIIGMTAGAVRDTCYEGEALDVDTPILTDRGWVLMGDLEVGNFVLAADGSFTRVNWTSDVYHDRPCFNLKFSDGAEIVADAQHKWWVRTEQAGYRVQTTQEMSIRGVRAGKEYHWRVSSPVETDGPGRSPIDPYVIGYWLGDGTTKNGTITTMDSTVVDQFHLADYKTVAYKWGSRGLAQTYGVYGLQTQLRKANLLNNKHVPSEAVLWSVSERLSLAQGMMDSDGDVSERGQCAFNNTNKGLVESLRTVLISLGVRVGAVRLNDSRDGIKNLWRITFTTNLPVFRIPRKLNRVLGHTERTSTRSIVAIDATTSRPVRCISIEHDSHVFLAGTSLTPTHNSGLVEVLPSDEILKYNRSLGQLTLKNGSRAFSFSGSDPEKLRGFQSNYLWMDELCAFSYPQEAWDMSLMGLRLGDHPRIIITTTPKPSDLIKELVARGQSDPEHVILTTGSTFDNSANLPDSTLAALRARYEGTTMGRQELYAELILDEPGALWSRKLIEENRVVRHDFKMEDMAEIVVAIDPSMSSVTERDSETGMIVAGRSGKNGKCYIIEDCSRLRPSPQEWGQLAIQKYHEYGANKIVAEVNQGYDLVTNLLNTLDSKVPVKKVFATRGGKFLRAEPIAALYEQGKVKHVGMFNKLEDQMTQWVPGKASPDRLDAMVWAVAQLMLGGGIAEFYSPNMTLKSLPGIV